MMLKHTWYGVRLVRGLLHSCLQEVAPPDFSHMAARLVWRTLFRRNFALRQQFTGTEYV